MAGRVWTRLDGYTGAARMSGNMDTSKIVDLQQRQASQSAGTDRVGELLKLVRTTALKRVNGLVSNLFENIDDALFDLAEKAENNTVQTGYFNGMREVRKKRQLVERMCQEHLGKIFRDFAAGKLEPMKPEAAGQPGEGLSLVNDQELEESLAIGSMVAKAENRHSAQLYAVNQRLSMIRGGASVENDTNPIAPAPLCQRCSAAPQPARAAAEASPVHQEPPRGRHLRHRALPCRNFARTFSKCVRSAVSIPSRRSRSTRVDP